ncbi:MAG: two-component sensor histidine kinase [Synechococcus sp. TMED187]|nr:MAG: two-component sensor histidine kinase [Synechococcus sp. TMED187]
MTSRRPWPFVLRALLGWCGLGFGSWALCLLLLQVLFGRQVESLQTVQLGRDLALNVRLAELALERYPPHLVSELTGLDLAVVRQPSSQSPLSPALAQQAKALQAELCRRLAHCPMVVANGRSWDVWVELISPLEPIWLRVSLRSPMAWPPEPTLLFLSLLGAGLSCGALFLLLEVERPLRGLEKALALVGDGDDPDAVPARGAPEVQRITHHFNAMLDRLAANRRDRDTMLAGIAHDLRAPITRLQFRLSMPALSTEDRDRCAGDLQSLERITGQFLLFAGGADGEDPVDLPLDQLLAEVSTSHPPERLQLDLQPVLACVKPVALGRAVGNLIDNAFTYGLAPVVVRLRSVADGALIEVWDQGEGMPAHQWERALQPFQRLDESRGEQGHCGLGLAIVAHVVRTHGGQISCASADGDAPGTFVIRLHLPSRPAAAVLPMVEKS